MIILIHLKDEIFGAPKSVGSSKIGTLQFENARRKLENYLQSNELKLVREDIRDLLEISKNDYELEANFLNLIEVYKRANCFWLVHSGAYIAERRYSF